MIKNKTDLMVIAPHPDDLEIACGGTIAKLGQQGKSVVAIDLTRGEMASRGTPELRQVEVSKANVILGIKARENLSIEDGKVFNTWENQIKIAKVVRKYRPQFVMVPYWACRHPDHYRSSELSYEAIFLAGLKKHVDGEEAFRPDRIIYYMLHEEFEPTFIVDISEHFEVKKNALMAYGSQFGKPEDGKEVTYISGQPFLDLIETRSRYYGSQIGRKYGEAFLIKEKIELADPLAFLATQGKTLNRPMG
jgi:bacillithiol biosynthesis deacetylase BshB1